MEKWMPICGYEGLYEISSEGKVASFHNGCRHILKPIMTNAGYYVVTLYGAGSHRQFFIHRLVAEAFLDKSEGCNVVDHINTIATDNSSSNLRWTTPEGNLKNPITNKRRLDAMKKKLKGKFGVDSLKHRGCVQMDKEGNVIKEWGCMSDTWRSLGIDSGSLTKACQGKQKTAAGFIWRYL